MANEFFKKLSFGNGQNKDWVKRQFERFRDSFVYLIFTAVISILPTISGYLMLKAFGKWSGSQVDWSKLLESGDLLIASTSLMATSVYVFRKKDSHAGFLKDLSSLIAVLIIVFASLFYGALALSTNGIIPTGTKMLPEAIVKISIVLYVLALCVGFHAFYTDRLPPSAEAVRGKQLDDLDADIDNLGGAK